MQHEPQPSPARDSVGQALGLLRRGLGPVIERQFVEVFQEEAPERMARFAGGDRLLAKKSVRDWDIAALLRVMSEAWNDVFRLRLGRVERSLVIELRDVRNRWAHQASFSKDDAYRALDSMQRLLAAVAAPEAAELEKLKTELMQPDVGPGARSAFSENPTDLLARLTTCDWSAEKVVRRRRDGSPRSRWSVDGSDPFAGNPWRTPRSIVAVVGPSAVIVAFFAAFTLLGPGSEPGPSVGQLVVGIILVISGAIALVKAPGDTKRVLVSIAVILFLWAVLELGPRFLPQAWVFRTPAFFWNPMAMLVAVVLLGGTVLFWLLTLPFHERAVQVLEYHRGEEQRFRMQLRELIGAVQVWEHRTQLQKKSTEVIGRERQSYFLAHTEQIETTYAHENNPAIVPRIRSRLGEYVTSEMRGDLELASRGAGEIERVLKAFGEHDWRCLQAALVLDPPPREALKPAPTPPPEDLKTRLMRQKNEALQRRRTYQEFREELERENALDEARLKEGGASEADVARRHRENKVFSDGLLHDFADELAKDARGGATLPKS